MSKMSEKGAYTPGDRSGRGEAIKEALKARKQEMGEAGAACASPPVGRAGHLFIL